MSQPSSVLAPQAVPGTITLSFGRYPSDYEDAQLAGKPIPLRPTSLADLLGNLPHGTLQEGGTPYTFRPPNLGTQKRLGAVAGNVELQKRPGRLAAYWLATALDSLAGEPMSGKADADALRVARLPIGDLLTLMFAWQREAHPEGLALPGSSCGTCGADFGTVRVNLDTLQVNALPEGVGLERRPTALVGLHRGFPFPKDRIVRSVVVRPPAWIDTLWDVGRDGWNNPALIRARMFRAAIAAVDTIPAPSVPEAALDELWPQDADLLDDAIGQVSPGPDLEVFVDCPSPGCGERNRTILDWRTPGFFSSSSRG